MERPTSALHLTRVTLSLRQLGAEPHTKEVGRAEVYNHHRVRSPRGHHRRRSIAAGPADASAPFPDVRDPDDPALRRAPTSDESRAVLLRSRPLWVRAAAGPDRAPDSM